MVKIALQLKATLDGITNLKPSDSDFRWYLKLRCNNCGDVTDKWNYVTLIENQPLKGSRGSASLVTKCKMCSRENSLNILEDHIKSYNLEDSGRFKSIVAFDCRGLEPVDFDPRSGFTAEGHDSGNVFSDIDLGTKEWTDYDEKAAAPVSIFEIEHQFIKM